MAVNEHQTVSNILFLVGIGANAEIYQPFLQQLQITFPDVSLQTLVWWQEKDFGTQSIKNSMQGKKTLLVGHSAGGVVALKTFQQWPQLVQKIIMLDSHIVHQTNKLPSIEKMMDIMLKDDSIKIQEIVKQAYAKVAQDDTQFYRAFNALVNWVNSDFENVASQVKLHQGFVLHIGFTDNNYQKYQSNGEQQEQKIWGKYGIDVRCLPMNHFDMIEEDKAVAINQAILNFLSDTRHKQNPAGL